MAESESLGNEIAWRNPAAAAFFGGVHENTVLYYFAESPFYDKSSSNAVVFSQLQAPGSAAIDTRQAFEAQVMRTGGVEYVVTQSHVNYGPDVAPNQGRWTIVKRYRERRDRLVDRVTLLQTYFVIGDVVCVAPSIGDVLQSKMLNSMQRLETFMQRSSKLPMFSPSRGHHYIQQPSKEGNRSRTTSAIQSRGNTPTFSQEDIPMTGSQEPTDAIKSSIAACNPSIADSRALIDSFQIFARYGNEYMDDVELVGEPGNFSFKRADVANPSASKSSQSQSTQSTQEITATQQGKDTDSPRVKNESLSEAEQGRDGGTSLRTKLKRKKSKAPISPASPLTTIATPQPADA